jgi:hypothetical protein
MLYGSFAHSALAARDLKLYFFVELDAAEFPAVHDAGIDADFAWQIEKHLLVRRVAENHGIGQAVRARDEFVANPEHVQIALSRKRPERAYTGMDAQEGIVHMVFFEI